MATLPSIPVKAPTAVEPPKVQTVYGPMIDLTTGETYTQAPKQVVKVTSWMQSQIDAGKMILVK